MIRPSRSGRIPAAIALAVVLLPGAGYWTNSQLEQYRADCHRQSSRLLAELTSTGAKVRSSGGGYFVKLDVRTLSPENIDRLRRIAGLGYVLVDGATTSNDELFLLSELDDSVMIEIRGDQISNLAVARLQAARPNSIVSRESATSPRGLTFPLAAR